MRFAERAQVVFRLFPPYLLGDGLIKVNQNRPLATPGWDVESSSLWTLEGIRVKIGALERMLLWNCTRKRMANALQSVEAR